VPADQGKKRNLLGIIAGSVAGFIALAITIAIFAVYKCRRNRQDEECRETSQAIPGCQQDVGMTQENPLTQTLDLYEEEVQENWRENSE
jgi:hypothetical protein